jgi:alcohol dehydrogenase
MQQLTFVGKQKLEWHEVPMPSLIDEKSVIVRPLTATTCDYDGLVIQGLIPSKTPKAMGHEGEGVIINVGDEVSRFQMGDRVIMPWKIACGTCTPCGRGHTGQCQTVAPETSYSWGDHDNIWGGFMSDAVLVPWADAMLTKMPAGADPLLLAGLADNVTDGWRAVGPHLAARPGGTVLVAALIGPGSIALYAAGWAVALGASRVVYADYDADRLARAAKMGAEPMDLNKEKLTSLKPKKHRMEGGFDITVDGGGDPNALTDLLHLTARAGVCVSTGGIMYPRQNIPFPVFEMYRKSMSFHTGWVHTQTLIDEPLRLIHEGIFDPGPVTSTVVKWEDAIPPLLEPFTKVILTR